MELSTGRSARQHELPAHRVGTVGPMTQMSPFPSEANDDLVEWKKRNWQMGRRQACDLRYLSLDSKREHRGKQMTPTDRLFGFGPVLRPARLR